MPPPVAAFLRDQAALARQSEAIEGQFPNTSPNGFDGLMPQGWGNPFRTALPQTRPDLRLDQIRSELFAQPTYTEPSQLEPWANETDVMRRAYLTLHRTEPVLRAAVDGKVKAVACLDVSVTPQDKESPRDREAAEYAEWAVGVYSRKGWEGLIYDVARPAVMTGFSVTEKVFGPSDTLAPKKWHGRWALAHAASKDTSKLRLRLDPFRNVTAIVSLVAGLESHDPGKVILFTHDDLFNNPYGQSDLRACYRSALFIEDSYKLWYVLLRNNNGPVVHGKTSKQDQVNKLRDALQTLRAMGVIATTKDDEIELLNFAAQGSFEAFERFVDKQRQEIYLSVRGAYLPFLEGSGQDNRGDTDTQKGAASDPVEHMLAKSVGRVLTHQLMPDLVRSNFGPDVGIPIVTLGGVSWGETKQQIDVIKTVMVDLKRPVSAKYIEQVTSVPGPVDADDVARVEEPAPPGVGGGDPFGGDDLLGGLGLGGGRKPPPTGGGHGPAAGSEFASPPRAGLVPKSGDPEHPERWVKPSDATGGGVAENKKAVEKPAAESGDGLSGWGKVRDLGNKALNTKVGRLLQAAEHKLGIAAHKTRDIAVNAARRRGLSDEQAARLKKTLAVADFVGGYVTGGTAAVAIGPLAGKAAAFLPSVSAVYLAYSAARDPAATWKAALEVVGNSSLDPRSLLKDLGAAWRGDGKHSAFSDDGSPAWVDDLAGLLATDPELADWRQAVFLAGLAAGGDPAAAVELAGQADPPGGVSAFVTDKDGHAHGDDGKFAPKGGGGQSAAPDRAAAGRLATTYPPFTPAAGSTRVTPEQAAARGRGWQAGAVQTAAGLTPERVESAFAPPAAVGPAALKGLARAAGVLADADGAGFALLYGRQGGLHDHPEHGPLVAQAKAHAAAVAGRGKAAVDAHAGAVAAGLPDPPPPDPPASAKELAGAVLFDPTEAGPGWAALAAKTPRLAVDLPGGLMLLKPAGAAAKAVKLAADIDGSSPLGRRLAGGGLGRLWDALPGGGAAKDLVPGVARLVKDGGDVRLVRPKGATFADRRDVLPVSHIKVDPDRFQFRRHADGDDGTAKELPAERFDRTKCPPLAVWEDPADGEAYVVDGHHRLAWAKRDGVDGLPVTWIDAATAGQAKAIGVAMNRTGKGGEGDQPATFRHRT